MNKKKLIRSILIIIAGVLLIFVGVLMIYICMKPSLHCEIDFTNNTRNIDVQSASYKTADYDEESNSVIETEYVPAKYEFEDGILELETKGGYYTTHSYEIVLLVDEQEIITEWNFIRTNGNNKKCWDCVVNVGFAETDGSLSANITCDNCESVEMISNENILDGMKVEIVEQFGNLK